VQNTTPPLRGTPPNLGGEFFQIAPLQGELSEGLRGTCKTSHPATLRGTPPNLGGEFFQIAPLQGELSEGLRGSYKSSHPATS